MVLNRECDIDVSNLTRLLEAIYLTVRVSCFRYSLVGGQRTWTAYVGFN